jgi:PD-(D/E)XK nuclease superfamily
VEGRVVVELKSVDGLGPIHEAIVLTYLRLSGHELGLLINFNVPLLKDGVRRFVMPRDGGNLSLNTEFAESTEKRTEKRNA